MQVMVYMLRIILLFLLVDLALSAISEEKKEGKPQKKKTTIKSKHDRSTSSSSNEKKDESSSGDSLELSFSSGSSDDGTKKRNKKKKNSKKYAPKSSNERTGWRKWHRKCQQCPEDMEMKWRDPHIKWICAGYQRARRSFKSLCMMHYRNCQDGTMFTKIADHRCPNDTDAPGNYKHGDHFFYDYSVDLSIDTTDSESKSSSSSETKSKSTSIDSKSWDSDKLGSFERNAINDFAYRKKPKM